MSVSVSQDQSVPAGSYNGNFAKSVVEAGERTGAWILDDLLKNRRWQLKSEPFPHVRALNVFTGSFYKELAGAFSSLLSKGLSETPVANRFSRNMPGYDAYGMPFAANQGGPFNLFISRPWHDMLAALFNVEATGHVNCGLHHHPRGSRSGWVHNDLNPGWFVNYDTPDGIRVARHDLCSYAFGEPRDQNIKCVETVRAIAMLYYLHNPRWSPEDGGVTGLYRSKDDPVEHPAAIVPPLNNSLLAFECTPFSFHCFISNWRQPRNCVIMWLHQAKARAVARWGKGKNRAMAARSTMNEKRVCLLTGASGTLGRAFCRLLADRYHVAAVWRRRRLPFPSQSLRLVDPLAPNMRLPENDRRIFAIQADLNDDSDINKVTDLALARFEKIDLLINAAVHSCWAPIIESSRLEESIEEQFRINVAVPIKLAASVARKFWRDRDQENRNQNRNVVNVSSTAGVYVYPNSWQSVYSASKAALNFATFHMAGEFASIGVRVNAVAPNAFPGVVFTENVIQEILQLDRGNSNGTVRVLDSNGAADYWPKDAVHNTPPRSLRSPANHTR